MTVGGDWKVVAPGSANFNWGRSPTLMSVCCPKINKLNQNIYFSGFCELKKLPFDSQSETLGDTKFSNFWYDHLVLFVFQFLEHLSISDLALSGVKGLR